MKIIMLATRCVCEDGWRVRVLQAGCLYEVREAAAIGLLRLGYARRVPE